jgi:hypothetical protein
VGAVLMSDLKAVSTRDLVAELATREGVTRHLVGVEDLYYLRNSAAISDLAHLVPATILVVVD